MGAGGEDAVEAWLSLRVDDVKLLEAEEEGD